jgi:hypothetical protein
MFEYVKIKIVQQAENTHWLFNIFVNTNKILNGRMVIFKDGTTGNHQIQHPKYSNWFDIPEHLIEIQSNL